MSTPVAPSIQTQQQQDLNDAFNSLNNAQFNASISQINTTITQLQAQQRQAAINAAVTQANADSQTAGKVSF